MPYPRPVRKPTTFRDRIVRLTERIVPGLK